jgi:hypothetical protein
MAIRRKTPQSNPEQIKALKAESGAIRGNMINMEGFYYSTEPIVRIAETEYAKWSDSKVSSSSYLSGNTSSMIDPLYSPEPMITIRQKEYNELQEAVKNQKEKEEEDGAVLIIIDDLVKYFVTKQNPSILEDTEEYLALYDSVYDEIFQFRKK